MPLATGPAFLERCGVFAGHQTRKDVHAAGADHIVMIAAAEGAAAHLEHAQTTAFGAIGDHHRLQADHAMDQTVQIGIVHLLGQIVDDHERAVALGEEMLERQHLAAVAEG